jgi:hypothetical protein
MGKPGNGVGLGSPGRVLDQIGPAYAVPAGLMTADPGTQDDSKSSFSEPSFVGVLLASLQSVVSLSY